MKLAQKIHRPKPVVLVICDGWGIAPDGPGNAITQAHTPFFNHLCSSYPVMSLRASGEAVGLAWGDMGNSEVGHLTLGAGRVFYQSKPRIDKDIEQGQFAKNKTLLEIFNHVKKHKSTLHIVGITSHGGVHGHIDHAMALITAAKDAHIGNIAVHAFLDGRDTVFNAGYAGIGKLQTHLTELGVGRIATLCGRYFSMDRDHRWDRTARAYDAIVRGVSDATARDPLTAIENSYSQKVYDEEFPPTVIVDEQGNPVAPVNEHDAVIFFNFREDRMRQIAEAFTVKDFQGFDRSPLPPDVVFASMTQYEKTLPIAVLYPPEIIETCLARVLSDAGLAQLHVGETEKYAHVTFFFNGMREEPFPGEARVIVPSPKVSTYDKKPEMSARDVAEKVVAAVKADTYDVIVANFANADMVGHTGDLAATIKAVQTVDDALKDVVTAVLSFDGVVFITADHGNAEEVHNLQTGEIDKEHSTNPVPFIAVSRNWEGRSFYGGREVGGDLSLAAPVGTLADVAPTILDVLGIGIDSSMTGTSLITDLHE